VPATAGRHAALPPACASAAIGTPAPHPPERR